MKVVAAALVAALVLPGVAAFFLADPSRLPSAPSFGDDSNAAEDPAKTASDEATILLVDSLLARPGLAAALENGDAKAVVALLSASSADSRYSDPTRLLAELAGVGSVPDSELSTSSGTPNLAEALARWADVSGREEPREVIAAELAQADAVPSHLTGPLALLVDRLATAKTLQTEAVSCIPEARRADVAARLPDVAAKVT
ncbi:MAG: hypothetical protein ACT4PT_09055, partial [Methanobacteriota archaeon]